MAATAPTATESKAMVAADLRIEYLDFLVSSSARAYTRASAWYNQYERMRSIHL